ncbi:MAG: tagatose 1,6-diphosphate aldolase [Candidatus Omnitrophica bacterium]|nr:tagatose 1,6-diphosphate aldolase [Candidatus Omnitrophota bacterium]
MQMTEGKYKRLLAVSTKKGVIAAAAMDQRGSLKKAIAQSRGVDPKEITSAMLSEFKTVVSKVLTPYASAILLDPEYGLEAVRARAKGTGCLLAYELTGYDQNQPGRIPELIPYWTVKKAIDAGADCIKILLYYTPFEKKEINEIKHAFVARIGAECAYDDVPFFLECVGYDPDGGDEKGLAYAKKKPEVVQGSMKEFSKPEYLVDVLKVEIPVNLQFTEGSQASQSKKASGFAYTREEAKKYFRECAQATAKPFIYLSAGVSDEEFREGLLLAIEAGIPFNGVLCGRATWQEGIPHYAKGGRAAFETWLLDRGVKNIQALNEVLDQGAQPWYARYGGLDRIQIVPLS